MKSKRKIYDYNPGIQSKNVVSYTEQLLAEKSAGARFEALRAAAEAETNRVRYQEARRLATERYKRFEKRQQKRIEDIEIDRRKFKTKAKEARLKNIKKITSDSRGISNQSKPEDLSCGQDGCKTVAARLSEALDKYEKEYQKILVNTNKDYDKGIEKISRETLDGRNFALDTVAGRG